MNGVVVLDGRRLPYFTLKHLPEDTATVKKVHIGGIRGKGGLRVLCSLFPNRPAGCLIGTILSLLISWN